MKLKINDKTKLVFKYLLIAGIFLYPFIHSFIGVDLGDTGLHTFMFDNLYDSPELIGFTSYFTSVIGWTWLQIFGGLGLWGLNILEVIIEMLMAFGVYKTFKNYLGEYKTLMGIFVAVVASDTYLNVFNYHQFNVFLLILILCFEFKAIEKDQLRYSVLAGIAFTTVVFSRMGSVTAIVTLFVYVFWYCVKGKKIKYLVRHIGSFGIGAFITAIGMILLLLGTGQMKHLIDNVFRLSDLASSSGNGYSMDNLLDTFIGGNLDAIASGAIFLAAAIILLLGFNLLFKKEEKLKRKIISILIALIAIGISIYQLIYAYDVNPVAAWPQMTTGPSFVIGVLYVVAFFCIVYHMYSPNGKEEIALIAIESIILPLLTIAGSNTGTKHVIIGLWIIAPIAVYTVLSVFEHSVFVEKLNQITSNFGLETKKITVVLTLLVVCVCFCGKFAHMIYNTMNFDSIDRSTLTSSINCSKVKFLKTTEREANAVNGVLNEINSLEDKEERPLMVYGGSLLFYYMTDMDSYVQPWFTNGNYSLEKLEADLKTAYDKYDKLPVVVYGRTNNYYGFYEADYTTQLNNETARLHSGKKVRLLEFLDEYDYKVEYVNDYYVVLLPPDAAESDLENYRGYITGDWS